MRKMYDRVNKMATYESASLNLRDFMKMLDNNKDSISGVKFLFYYAANLEIPAVRRAFCKWIIDDREVYVVYGKDTNFIYAYEKTDLAFMVKYDPGTLPFNNSIDPSMSPFATAYHVKILKNNSVKNTRKVHKAYTGNHVDIGISKAGNDTLVKTHYTSYSDWDQPTAKRNADPCNFNLGTTLPNIKSMRTFLSNQKCYNQQNVEISSVQAIYGANTLKSRIVYNICRMLVGLDYEGKIHDNDNVWGGCSHRMCVKGSRGGRYYLSSSGKRRYIRGGAPGDVTYKGITFYSEHVEKCIRKWFIEPVKEFEPRLTSVQVFFDEWSELNDNGSDNIVVFYDFDEGEVQEYRKMFFLNTNIILKACYVESKPTETIKADELSCHQEVLKWSQRMIPAIVHAF